MEVMRSSIYFIMEERRSWGSKGNMNLMVWVLWEVVSECEFVMIHLPCLSFKQYVLLQASEMMKSFTLFDFHLSLENNMSTAFSRSAAKCIITNSYSLVTLLRIEREIKLIFGYFYIEALGEAKFNYGEIVGFN